MDFLAKSTLGGAINAKSEQVFVHPLGLEGKISKK